MITGIEGWMVSGGIALATAVSTYAVLRDRHTRLEEDLKAYSDTHSLSNQEIERKIDAGFRKQDNISERVTILERDTATHLDMTKAEDKFVSHKELALHMQNIENTLKHTEKSIVHMSSKLDELTNILSTNIVRTLSGSIGGQ